MKKLRRKELLPTEEDFEELFGPNYRTINRFEITVNANGITVDAGLYAVAVLAKLMKQIDEGADE